MKKFRMTTCIICLLMVFHLSFASATEEISEVAQAVMDAKRDAEQDTSRFIPFSVGCLAGGGLMIGTAFAMTKIIETDAAQEHPIFASEGDFDVTPACAAFVCVFGPIAAAAQIPTAVFAIYESTPPTERFLGKSPEYVSAYTRAYTKKGKEIRTLWSRCGTFTGGLALMVLAMSLLD